MSNDPEERKQDTEKKIKEIRRRTRRKFSAEEKTRIILQGMRGDETIAEFCRREGIAQTLYYSWSKEFMEAGKRRLKGDIRREANTKQVKELREENIQLKLRLAEAILENDVLKKSLSGLDEDGNQA